MAVGVAPAQDAMWDDATLSWELNSTWFVLLGGARAAILQVADPGVAAGVAEYSSYRTDPLGRLERTMDAVVTIGFGSERRRAEVLAELESIHSRVRGRTAEGAAYSALDPRLMYWVLATLVDTVMEVERRWVGRWGEAERERYVAEAAPMAAAFGIPKRFVPADLAAFRAYMAERFSTLEPSDASRDVTASLLAPGLRFVPDAAFAPLDWITVDLLPPRLRRELGLHRLTPLQRRTVRAARSASLQGLHRLPAPLRVSPYAARTLRRAARAGGR